MNKQQLYKTRISAAGFYFVMGLIFASWASRIPDIKFMLRLSDGDLGQALFAIPAGQLGMMFLSGYLVNRLGSRITLLVSIVMYAVILTLIALSDGFWMLFSVLFLFGAAANTANIAVNTQASALELLYGRNIMASFHGLWSLGGLLGGVLGALFARTDYSVFTHFVFVATAGIVGIAVAGRNLLSHDTTEVGEKAKRFALKPDRVIVILGLIGFAGMFCEGTMFDWSSVYFASVVKPDESLIRMGYIAGMGAMTLGRFVADRLVTRYQASTVLKGCGLLVTAGLLLATIIPGLICSTIGFLLVGLGVSSIVPICYSAAGKSGTMAASIAITVVSSISFLGFMIGPPLIGLLSEATDLRIALAVASLFGVVIFVLSQKFQTMKIATHENRSFGNLGG